MPTKPEERAYFRPRARSGRGRRKWAKFRRFWGEREKGVPDKLTKHEPFRDFKALSQTCREIEQKYGLVVDRGMEEAQTKDPQRVPQRAQAMEAHSGQESFDTYVRKHQENIREGMKICTQWEDVHRLFATWGMEYALRGNGAVLSDAHGKHQVKPSSILRELSKPALEKRFGTFQSSGLTQDAASEIEQERYQAKPLQRGPERDGLYDEYQQGIKHRKSALAEIKNRVDDKMADLKRSMDARRDEIKRTHALMASSRGQLLREVAVQEERQKAIIKKDAEDQRKAVKEAVPFWNWTGFLQRKTENGNEMALAILRSKKQIVEPEPPLSGILPTDHGKYRLMRKEIMARADLLQEDKVTLMAVSRMNEVAADNPHIQGFKWRVDSKGVILFTLPSGGVVRDAQNELLFSTYDPDAREVAAKLALFKFGRSYNMEGNRFYRGRQQQMGR